MAHSESPDCTCFTDNSSSVATPAVRAVHTSGYQFSAIFVMIFKAKPSMKKQGVDISNKCQGSEKLMHGQVY